MNEEKNCLTCKHKRRSGDKFLCAYSPMHISRISGSNQVCNYKLEECRTVKVNKAGKCFMFENWEPITKNKSISKKIGILCGDSFQKTKGFLSQIKIKRV